MKKESAVQMKRFIRIVSVFVVCILVVAIVPAVVVDPYNVIHWRHLRNNGVEPNKSYIKTRYILSEPDRFDAFMFGSSRVSAIHTNLIQTERIYNMTCSEGVPSDHLETIQTFLENGVRIKKIYVGVDSLSYTIDGSQHDRSPLRCSYRFLHNNPEAFFNLFCNPWLNLHALYIAHFKPNKAYYPEFEFYAYGWHSDYGRKTTIDWSKAKPSVGSCYLLDETLDDIRSIVDLCERNRIETVFFTNPMYEMTYRESLKYDYPAFLKSLAQITDYVNFSGLNNVTTNRDNYIDTSHYNAYIGDMIVHVIADGKRYDGLYEQGFGRVVTKDNVDELLRILRAE